MLVTRINFESSLEQILRHAPTEIAVDTETMGVHWWKSPWHPRPPRVFSIQFYYEVDGKEFGYYFDFGSMHSTHDHLDSLHFAKLQWKVFSNTAIYWYIQNAKFDMHQLANHDCTFAGEVHCTKAIARVLNNNEPKLSLDDLSFKYFGEQKIDVKTFLKENGGVEIIKSPYDHGDGIEALCFDRLPLPMLIEYGIRDTKLTYQLGKFQRKKIAEIDEKYFGGDETTIETLGGKEKRNLTFVMNNENRLTKVLFAIERQGAKIDVQYCEAAFEHEKACMNSARAELEKIAESVGLKDINWNANEDLSKVFDALNIPYGTTAKGNKQFTKYTLEDTDHDVAKQILIYRNHYKRAYTYFKNFLELVDVDGFIHPDFQPAGAVTGRFSCWNPNLQNVPKRADKQEKDYPIRRAFVNISDDFYLFSFDFDQMEYRLMLNYANESDVAKRIVEGNLDVHQALADEVGLGRDDAKNLNFAVLYGAGIAKIAKMGNTSEFEAKQRRKNYFNRLPGVKEFIDKVRNTAKIRGYIFNICGRVLQYDVESHWKASNGIIQGGCADIMKLAMVKIFPHFAGKKSKMFLQVHDELCAYIHKDELDLVPVILAELEGAYAPKILPLTSGVAYSNTAWNELKDGIP